MASSPLPTARSLHVCKSGGWGVSKGWHSHWPLGMLRISHACSMAHHSHCGLAMEVPIEVLGHDVCNHFTRRTQHKPNISLLHMISNMVILSINVARLLVISLISSPGLSSTIVFEQCYCGRLLMSHLSHELTKV